MEIEMKHYPHKVGVNVHHLEWCTKYRYSMFKQDKYKNLCETILRETAERHQISIRELFVMPEHIHVSIGWCGPLLYAFSHRIARRKRFPKKKLKAFKITCHFVHRVLLLPQQT